MSAFKGTPGPWFAGEQSEISGWVEINIPGYSRNSVACATPATAGDAEARRDTETLANARLIAAAPELLEALLKLVDSCDDSDGAQYGTLSASFVRGIAAAAIAKATGGAA